MSDLSKSCSDLEFQGREGMEVMVRFAGSVGFYPKFLNFVPKSLYGVPYSANLPPSPAATMYSTSDQHDTYAVIQARIYLGPFGPFGPGPPGHKQGSHREPQFDEILRLRQLKPLRILPLWELITKFCLWWLKLSKNSPPAVKIVKFFASRSCNC